MPPGLKYRLHCDMRGESCTASPEIAQLNTVEKWRAPITIRSTYPRSNLIISCFTSVLRQRKVGMNEPKIEVDVQPRHGRQEQYTRNVLFYV